MKGPKVYLLIDDSNEVVYRTRSKKLARAYQDASREFQVDLWRGRLVRRRVLPGKAVTR